MEWFDAFLMLIQYVAAFASFGSFIYLFYSKIDRRFDKLEIDIKETNRRHDEDFKHLTTRLDRLYEMFFELLKEGKK